MEVDERIKVRELKAFIQKYLDLNLLALDEVLNVKYYLFDDIYIPFELKANNLTYLKELGWHSLDYKELPIDKVKELSVIDLLNELDSLQYKLSLIFI